MFLSDAGILERMAKPVDSNQRLSIQPFVEVSPPGVISYGLTSGGYDVRLGRRFKVFTDARCARVDPKRFDPASFVQVEADVCEIPPHGFVLGLSVEELEIPRDVIGVCIGKSTYVRCGILACCTPLEPEWRGYITVEISNTSPCPACIYAGEGILQVLFGVLDRPCNRSYADKGGIYQDQRGITLPRVRDVQFRVRHADLPRVGDSAYSSFCPRCCKPGLRTVRSRRDLLLQAYDACSYCGLQVEYTDIAHLRATEEPC